MMARGGLLLVCFLVLAAFANAYDQGSIALNTPNNLNNIPVATWSDYIFVQLTKFPAGNDLQLALSANVTTGFASDGTAQGTSCDISPNTPLKFDGMTRSLSFRVYCTQPGTLLVTITKSGDTTDPPQFTDPGTVNGNIVKRGITVEDITNPTYVQQFSDPLTIKLKVASSGPLTFHAMMFDSNTNDSVATPLGDVTIPAGALTGQLFFRNSEQVTSVEYNLTVTGNEVDYYATDALTFLTKNFRVTNRVVSIVDFNTDVVLGGAVNTLTLYTPQLVNSSLEIIPQAADVTFNPSSVVFGPSTTVASPKNGQVVSPQVAKFTFTTNSRSDATGANYGAKNIFWTIHGNDKDFYVMNGGDEYANFKVPTRTISVDYPNDFVISNQTYMSIRIDQPVVSSLKVTLNAANLQFNTTTVEFKGSVTAIVILVTPIFLGADTLSYNLDGDDKYFFTQPADMAYTVNKKNFITPYYPGAFWVGVQSDPIPVRASVSPNKAATTDYVNLVPVGRNLKFNPSILTFRDGQEQQYFTVTPMYSNEGDGLSYSTAITYLVTGEDGQYTVYDPPAAHTITVQKRMFQASWSAHLNTLDPHANAATVRHLHKTYKIWVSANYVNDSSESTSVIPVSPFWSFKPAVMWFNTDNTRYLLEATVTGVAKQADSIKFIIGGTTGGLYNPIAPLQYSGTAIRPLDVVAATLSPDERSKGVWIGERIHWTSPSEHNETHVMELFAPSYLTQYHVQDFLVRSFVLPDSDLTITPHCNHAEFSPKSITLKGSHGVRRIDNTLDVYESGTVFSLDRYYHFNVTGVYLEANFSVKALAGGTHPVWFELSGADMDYYTKPSGIQMTFNLVMRPASEPFRVSSSSFLFPSFVVVAAMAIISLVM